jgi:hypothetical protein
MTVQQLRPSFDLGDLSTCVLDLEKPSPKDVLAIVAMVSEKARTTSDLGPLPVTTGWNEITPATALDLLLRRR